METSRTTTWTETVALEQRISRIWARCPPVGLSEGTGHLPGLRSQNGTFWYDFNPKWYGRPVPMPLPDLRLIYFCNPPPRWRVNHTERALGKVVGSPPNQSERKRFLMIMADVLKIVFLIAGFMVVYVCYWLASEALFPDAVSRAAEQYQQRPIRITLFGLGILAPVLLVGIGLGQVPHPALKALSVVVLGIPLLLALLGSAGLCKRLGEGLPSITDEQQPWRRVLRGGVVLTFTFLLPFIGWFVVMPWALVSGLGAAIVVLKRRQPISPVMPPVVPEVEAAV